MVFPQAEAESSLGNRRMSKLNLHGTVVGSLLVAVAVIWLIGIQEAGSSRLALILIQCACLAAASLWWGVTRSKWRGMAVLLWGIAIVLRLCIWFSPTALSDDVYRYLWDGKVQLAGVNPYRFAPSDPRLPVEIDQDYQAINHKEIPSIYPPLAQGLALFLTKIKPSVWTFKAAFAAMDLLLGLLLYLRMRQSGNHHQPALLILYLWHPLMVFEFAGSGHVDIVWTILLFLSIWDVERGRPWRASLWLAGAISAKLIAVAFVPLFLSRTSWRQAGTALALAACTWLPYADSGFSLWSGLQAYSLFWDFNSFGFALMGLLPKADLWARAVAPLLGLAGAIWVASQSKTLWWKVSATTALLISLLPVNYPWYWPLLVVLTVIRPRLSWYLFSLSLMLTYDVLPKYYSNGDWHLALWVRLVEAGLLIWGWADLLRERDEGQ